MSHPADPSSLDLYDLAERLDRSVLLGDPGGGKTTAANVLMHHFARDPAAPVPFLVTLRDYAAKDPPERSVAEHVEHTLETFYQCPAPAGLVDLLLLSGRAVVVFDGLDELLDTSRRADVTTRVERFCAEYLLHRGVHPQMDQLCRRWHTRHDGRLPSACGSVHYLVRSTQDQLRAIHDTSQELLRTETGAGRFMLTYTAPAVTCPAPSPTCG
jgi:hypothetical protein